MTGSLRKSLDEGPMNRFQWAAVSVCVLLNMLDGFDVLVMSFTGKAVMAEWDLSGAQLGLLLSAGLVGMAAGSMLLAPWADRVGRRPMILLCLAIASVGLLLSSVSQSATQLGALRIATGVGIGGILASSNVIASEYASRRWRGLVVSLNSTGYALGATLGGLVSVMLLAEFGWRAVFLFGGVATAVGIPVVFALLPESLDFLLARRPARALDKVNQLTRKLGLPTLDHLPAAPVVQAGVGAGFRKLLSSDLRRASFLLWTAFFLVMAGFYFVTSWTPTLLTKAGLSTAQGVTGGTLLNLGGIFGATLLGLLAARFALRSVLIAYVLATAVMLGVFIAATSSLAAALVLGAAIGVAVNGCVAGLYALTPIIYDSGVRATGVGAAIGIGRIGAIAAPAVAGALLDVGWTPQSLYLTVGVVFAATAVLLLLLRPAVAAEPKPAPATSAQSTN
ncbi:MFS transporter [Saccharopolyspora sp. 5N102]|uniref:MFS transporter n=1 Tax=Saccharopolyspora sp. 5N102 TaxID=3375155 RepID=UPI003796895E